VTLAEALDAEAAGLEGVERRTTGDTIEWRAGGLTFAAASGDVAEFRLSPAVAAAARATPDSGSSSRGPEWVRFSPPDFDRYARDRAVAWFGSGWRESKRPR
jgi:hypothetical protein